MKRAHFGLLRTKTIEDVDKILKFLLRESETIGLASKIYLLVERIENIRELIKRLFWIMEKGNKKEKDNELARTRLRTEITDEEYKTLGNELTAESISRVLKARGKSEKL